MKKILVITIFLISAIWSKAQKDTLPVTLKYGGITIDGTLIIPHQASTVASKVTTLPVEIKTIENKGSYWLTLDQTYKNPDGSTDNVLHWGYNSNGTGGLVNIKEPSFHDAWESNYTKFLGSAPVFERHMEVNALDSSGNILKTRLFSFQASRTKRDADMQLRSTRFGFYDMFDRTLIDFNENGNYTWYGKGNTTLWRLINRTDATSYTVQAVGGAVTHATNGAPNIFDGQIRTPSIQMGNNVFVFGVDVSGNLLVTVNGVTRTYKAQ